MRIRFFPMIVAMVSLRGSDVRCSQDVDHRIRIDRLTGLEGLEGQPVE
jgi:hypothetical protein